MIYLLLGDNSYERSRLLQRLQTRSEVQPERFDGSQLTIEDLPNILMGQTLFSQARLIIVRELEANKQVWPLLPEWLERMSDDVTLILDSVKPDKRSKTYKYLQSQAEVHELTNWTERDNSQAVQWLIDQAAGKDLQLSGALARQIVMRAGLNQWYLAEAIEKLSLIGKVDEAVIDQVVEASPTANIFSLLETTLKGDQTRLMSLLRDLELTEEGHKVLGLLAGQAVQILALAAAGPRDDVAKDFAIHPYVITKLRPQARKLGLEGAKQVVDGVRLADERVKSTGIKPWLAIEQALVAIAAKQKISQVA